MSVSVKDDDAESSTSLLTERSTALEIRQSTDSGEEKKRVTSGETMVPCSTQLFWLFVWMLNNVLVTLTNKAAFAKVNFKYPYALSAIHMSCNIVGTQLYFAFSKTKQKQLDGKYKRSIIYFSIIFALNIAIGNTSLSYVSVNFNQVCRAMVPVLVMLMSIFYYGKTYTQLRKYSVLPIVFGVALAVWGDMSYTYVGAMYTWFCVLLAALKSVAAGELLTGDLKLHEMDLLSKMCPYALVQICLASLLTGEVSQIWGNWDVIMAGGTAPRVILFSGILSFSLNVSSFVANKVTSALTLSIGANVKQVLVIAISSAYFGDEIGPVHGAGIIVVMLGSFAYGYVSANRL